MKMDWYQKSVVVGGLLFDSLFVPAMLWKRTRNMAFMLSTVFHIHNVFVFNIGIFPFMMIAMNVFFYPPEQIGHMLRRAEPDSSTKPGVPVETLWYASQKLVLAFGSIYFLLQVLLPLRHLTYPGNVHWTEQGHRMAWQMMLKSKRGIIKFSVRTPCIGNCACIEIQHLGLNFHSDDLRCHRRCKDHKRATEQDNRCMKTPPVCSQCADVP